MYHIILYFAILVLTVAVVGSNRPKELEFVPWGKQCRIPSQGESLKPQERCSESRGMHCQQYHGGDYHCLCDQKSEETSYDNYNKECRLKVGKYCHYVNATADPDSYARLPFNLKCLERAECVPFPFLLEEGNRKKSEDIYTCACKDGYITSSDSQCHHPNFATSATVNRLLFGLAFLFGYVKNGLILHN